MRLFVPVFYLCVSLFVSNAADLLEDEASEQHLDVGSENTLRGSSHGRKLLKKLWGARLHARPESDAAPSSTADFSFPVADLEGSDVGEYGSGSESKSDSSSEDIIQLGGNFAQDNSEVTFNTNEAIKISGTGTEPASSTTGIPVTDIPLSDRVHKSDLARLLVFYAVWYLTSVFDNLVDIMLLQVPLEADMELGRQTLKEFPHRTIYHPKYTPLIQSIGWDLVEASYKVDPINAGYYQWDFRIIDGDDDRAFAVIGGVVGMANVQLDRLDLTRGELAALIGHEMAHVLHRHSLARRVREDMFTLLRELIPEHHEGIGETKLISFKEGLLLLRSANWLGQQSFSRKDEYEADATSWDLLQAGGQYHPNAMQSLLEKTWAICGRQNGKTSWASTHPGYLDRIEALDQKWKDLSAAERRRLTQNTIR